MKQGNLVLEEPEEFGFLSQEQAKPDKSIPRQQKRTARKFRIIGALIMLVGISVVACTLWITRSIESPFKDIQYITGFLNIVAGLLLYSVGADNG